MVNTAKVSDQSSPQNRETKPHGSEVTHQPTKALPIAQSGRHPQKLKISINCRNLKNKEGALVDRGANGGIAGKDTRVMDKTTRTIDLSGVDDHTVRNLEIVTAGAVVRTQLGEVILRLNQYAYMRDAKTIHSCLQMEWFKNTVSEKAPAISDVPPCITTLEGYKIPIYIKHGLPYIRMRPYTDYERENLIHVNLTSVEEWDPKIADYEINDDWYSQQEPQDEFFKNSMVNENGELYEERETRQGVETNKTMIAVYLHNLIIEELADSDEEPEVPELMCNDAETTLRRSKRTTTRHNYNPKTKRKEDTKKRGEKKVTPKKPGPVTPRPSEWGDSDDDTPRTDFNNQAKSTDRDRGDIVSGPILVKPSKKEYADYARYFCGAPELVIEKTFEATTQYGRVGTGTGLHLWKQIKSPSAATNHPRRNEPVATDTVYGPAGFPAVDNGSTAAQFFIGRKSGFRSIRPSGNSDGQFTRTLMDEIRSYGAMDTIISDCAKAEISTRCKDILRTFMIRDWQSEPHNKNQNFAERGWRDTQRMTNTLLNYSGGPPFTWLLALQYVCFVINHTASERLGWRTPIEWLLGWTPDITVLLRFIFWEPVYYLTYGEVDEDKKTKKLKKPMEALGRFVGISKHVGHAMTYKILTEKGKVISRAVIRTANKKGVFLNKRATKDAPKLAPKDEKIIPETVIENDDEDDGETEGKDDERKAFITSALNDILDKGGSLPTIDVESLLGRTFISQPDEAGEQARAKVEEGKPTNETTADGTQQLLKFKYSVGDKVFEEVMTYNQMLAWCDEDEHKDDMFTFKAIHDHKKVGTVWYVLVEWTSGHVSWNSLDATFDGDPTTCAMYALKNKLLDQVGWSRCRRYTKNAKTLARMANQTKLRSLRNRPVYQYGHQVPRHHKEAVFIDDKNGNTKWQDSEALELKQLFDYDSFEDKGKNAVLPDKYTVIPCHFVYAVKHDGRYKSRWVAGGHRTETPVDSVYSGVVSLEGIRVITTLAELNGCKLWATDIGNAYLESVTKEYVAFIAGEEFGDKAGHTFIIVKAQYGLRSSGKRWHERLHDVLTDMGFFPSRAERDVWMRNRGDHYRYIAVYVDDLRIASKVPQTIIDALECDVIADSLITEF